MTVDHKETEYSAPFRLLIILTLTFSVGHIDRQILNLLVQPIKARFHASDIEIGMLQGVAFSVPYLIMSPLFGRWVDVARRKTIILGCVGVWSVFTALCGFCTSFVQLFAARAAVGVAEAGLTPAAYSMMGDAFDDKKLGRAMSIYNMGPYLGGGMALLLGGLIINGLAELQGKGVPLLSTLEPWQATFLLTGLLSLVCLLLMTLVPEPRRAGAHGAEPLLLKDAVGLFVSDRRFYGGFYAGMGLAILPIYSFPAWMPALLIRQYHLSIAHVGLTYGAITLLCGSLGVLTGPSVSNWFRHRNHIDAHLRVAVVAATGLIGCCIALALRTGPTMVFVIGGVASFFYSLPTAPAATAVQVVTPGRARGMATSIYVVVATIAGLAVAPLLIAFVTDKIFADEVRVGDSLALVGGVAALCSATIVWRTLPAYRRKLIAMAGS